MDLAAPRALSTNPDVAVAGRAAPLDDVVTAYLARHFALRPVDATFVGIHERDGHLPDWSPAGLEQLRGECADWRATFRQTGVRGLTPTTLRDRAWPSIDAALIDSYLEVQQGELDTPHFLCGNPSLATGEVAFAIIGLITRDFASPADRAAQLVTRLQAVERFLAGAVSSWHAAATTVPTLWAERALKECAATQRLLQEGLPRWIAHVGLDARQAETVRDAATSALRGLANADHALRALRSPDLIRSAGPELLDLLVRRGHWCDRSLDELLVEARSALADERGRLDDMAGPSRLPETLARLASRHPSAQDYYAAFGQVWEACHEVARAHDLVTWPQAPIRYVAIPPWTAMVAGSLYYLYYRSPAPYDRAAVHEYVVPPLDGLAPDAQGAHLRVWNDSTIKLNHVVHHGALGHHVQNAFAARAPSRVGRLAATDCASRIAMFLGGTMAEGWACYATDLMDEVGFLTPDERVAEQQSRVRMAARAVVDLELHTGRRSYDEAVTLYTRDVGMSVDAARGEVVKNSMFPGTALMYWLGTRAIHTLRGETARREGSQFSLRRFHDELLSFGSLPVPLIAELMRHAPGTPAF